MITFKTGNLFEDIEYGDAIVNTVNCVGVMGKGIALEFKKRYPDMFKYYQKECSKGNVKIGSMLVYYKEDGNSNIIINFPTKQHWKNPSKYDYIIEGLDELKKTILNYDIKTIRIPALGCTNGGLKFSTIKELIEVCFIDKRLKDVNIIVYEPIF